MKRKEHSGEFIIMKSILIPFLMLAACFAGLWKWTNGFEAFTVFSYTLQDAGSIPRSFPDIPMINQNGKVFHIKNEHKYVLVNFVYLDCPGVCERIDNRLEKIYQSMNREDALSKIKFITISFDPQDDNLQRLKAYHHLLGTDLSGWDFAIPYQTGQSEFKLYLQEAGVWMYKIPATGIINHSIYIFLISPDNKIVQVFNPARESNTDIAEKIQSCVNGHTISSL
jgi:protein SCO1/2